MLKTIWPKIIVEYEFNSIFMACIKYVIKYILYIKKL